MRNFTKTGQGPGRHYLAIGLTALAVPALAIGLTLTTKQIDKGWVGDMISWSMDAPQILDESDNVTSVTDPSQMFMGETGADYLADLSISGQSPGDQTATHNLSWAVVADLGNIATPSAEAGAQQFFEMNTAALDLTPLTNGAYASGHVVV